MGIKQLKKIHGMHLNQLLLKGSIHEGTAIKLIGTCELFPCHMMKHTSSETHAKVDDSSVVENEKIKFKVLEFNKDVHKIVVSHTLTFLD